MVIAIIIIIIIWEIKAENQASFWTLTILNDLWTMKNDVNIKSEQSRY